MAIGLLYGRESLSGDKSAAVDLTCRWREIFLDHFRHLQCRPIYDLVREPGQPGTCAVIAREAAAALVELLEEYQSGCDASMR